MGKNFSRKTQYDQFVVYIRAYRICYIYMRLFVSTTNEI